VKAIDHLKNPPEIESNCALTFIGGEMSLQGDADRNFRTDR